MTTDWKTGRGLLGPLQPLMGHWIAEAEINGHRMSCTRSFEPFGKGWVRLEAAWQMGERGQYRETAFLGACEDGGLGFASFTNDGKRSTGRLSDGTDVHPRAVAFEAQMPAGLARMIYWPAEEGPGFRFAVESRNKTGWNRFLMHTYRPQATP
jgi:hypothetical protein